MTEKQESYGDVTVVDNSPAGLMRVGAAGGMKLAELKELFELQKEYEANEGRKDHFAAFAIFKTTAPKIKHDKVNPRFKSGYTSLGHLLDVYEGPLAEQGLSLDFPPPEQTETTMTVTCRRVHKSGHIETFSMSGPIDKAAIGKASGQASRNAMQDIKSTFTYLRSACVEAALGVAGTEATLDNDGNLSEKDPEFVTKEQVLEMSKIITDKNLDLNKLLNHWKIEDLAAITTDDFPAAMRVLNKAKPRPKDREPGEEG